MATGDKREKERRGRPKEGQRMTTDGHKDMRGRPDKDSGSTKLGLQRSKGCYQLSQINLSERIFQIIR
jgi:hypothetical protein